MGLRLVHRPSLYAAGVGAWMTVGACIQASVGGGGRAVDDPTDASSADRAPDVAPRTTPTIPGFDLAPNVGDFWEYEIQEGRPFALVPAVQRLTLVRAVTVVANGSPQRVFDAEWRVVDGADADRRNPVQLAFVGHRILVNDPATTPPSEAGRPGGWPNGWVVIFDAWNGVWPVGDALFGGVPAGVPVRAEPATWQGRDVWQARAIGGAQCQYVPGYGQLCGDDDPSRVFNTSEFYAPGIGVVAHTFLGCSSGGCFERRVNLLAWRVGSNASPTTPGRDAGVATSPEDTDAACSDGRDNDGDSYVDCMDFNCSRNPAVTVCPTDAGVLDAPPARGPEDTNAACTDGRDNDGDGYVDCADFNCSRNAAVTVCRG